MSDTTEHADPVDPPTNAGGGANSSPELEEEEPSVAIDPPTNQGGGG